LMECLGPLPVKIFDYTHDQFVDAFQRRYNKRAHYSSPIYRQVMTQGALALGELAPFARAPELVRRLESELVITMGRLVKKEADGDVVKFVTALADGLRVESVVIPMFRRHTLCVSSQVGCRMGCRFCRTGKMGLIRNLTTSEIVEQVFVARHHLGADIRNVVFMGMGEPLDNLDNVIQAVRVLEDQRGMDIARRYITISTVGLPDGIDRLARLDGPPLNLAVSLNAPDDVIRSRLMPVNRTHPMAALQDALRRYPLTKKSSIFVEYVLIQGINDRPEHARALSAYLSPLRVKLNLIPCNPAPGSRWKPPSAEAFLYFRKILENENIFVRRRHKKGERIMAACGQLGGEPRPAV
jgi:23S rRNA (adenine2503-C2)-methyltransferase